MSPTSITLEGYGHFPKRKLEHIRTQNSSGKGTNGKEYNPQDLSPDRATYKITDDNLKQLQKKGLPKGILNKLVSIKGKPFIGDDKFIASIRKAVGDKQIREYKVIILKFAVFS